MNADAPLPSLDIDLAVREAAGALGDAEVRDDLHLKPRTLSRAANARALRAVRALEAFVRRLLLLIALQFEHHITVDVSHRPYPKKHPKSVTRAPRPGIGALRIFPSDLAFPVDLYSAASPFDTAAPAPAFATAALPAAPIIARIQRLRAMLDTAEARGHRLAFTLARRRHGLLLAPLPLALPNRMGTGVTSLYGSLGHAIFERSRARPPPQKPRPPPPPRARFI
jgi:hypothetical protein